MKKTRLIDLSLASALACSSLAAGATEFYFSDCQAGADPACVPGNNSNSGTSPGAPKQDLSGFTLKKLASGEHTLRFARGAAWNLDYRVFLGNFKNAGQAMVLTDYRPAWSSGAAAPIMHFATASESKIGFALQNAGDGYTLRNLDLLGPGESGGEAYVGTAIFFFGTVSNVLIDNLTIRNFGIGIQIAEDIKPGGQRLEKITVRNSRVLNNYAQGLLGGGHNVTIENNLFDNNGFKGGYRYHNIYLSTYAENMVVRGNTLTHSGMVDGLCTSVSLVGHDHLINTLIENNTIVELAANFGCYGIDINGYQNPGHYMGLERTTIRGNTVVVGGNGGLGIGVNACPDCVIENNAVVGLGKTEFTGIKVPDGSFTSEGAKDDAVTVRNNSIYIASPSAGAVGISVNAPGANDDKVVSNLIYFAPGTSAKAQCFRTAGRELPSYAAFGNNLCFRAGGGANVWSDQFATLAAAQAAGWDKGSLAIDPLLAVVPSANNRWSMALLPRSPAVNAGARTLSAAKDITGNARDGQPDIGAFESGNRVAPAPGAPTGVVVR